MNGAVYNNDIVNANIRIGRYAQDPKERKVAYDKVQTQLMTDKPYFPMVYENVLYGTHPRVGNVDKVIFGSKLADLHLLTRQF